MKIMLVNSPWINDTEKYGVKAGARWAHVRSRKKTIPYYPFPFAMAYAAALLRREGFDARLLDAVALGMTRDETLEQIREFAPVFIVVETSTPSIYFDLEFAQIAHNDLQLNVVFSGPHATALPADVLEMSPALAVLRGEYDETLLELARAMQNGTPDMRHISGLSWKDSSTIVHNENRPLIQNLDDLPFPQREGLPMAAYTDPACKKFPNVSIITSRGCPHQCVFCLESTVFYHSPSLRTRDPDRVVEEMKYVVKNHNAREVYFDDASFTASIPHARSVCDAILRHDLTIPWSCMADARVDYDTLKLMRRAGCIGLKFGVETADPEIMNRINKHLNLDPVREFADNCRKLGLYTHGTFMFGLPGETPETIQRTIDYAFSLKCTTSQFSVATPFPGTAFYDTARAEGWLVTDDWSRFDGANTPVIQYPGCRIEDITSGLDAARKRKIIALVTHPVVLSQYLLKLYKIKGFQGLFREIAGKSAYLMERKKKAR